PPPPETSARRPGSRKYEPGLVRFRARIETEVRHTGRAQEVREMSAGILLLRLAVGPTVAAHGAQKLFGAFGGHGLEGTAQFLESLGFRPGRLHAWALGAGELVGGIMLATGLLTPLGAAAVIGVMAVAALVV